MPIQQNRQGNWLRIRGARALILLFVVLGLSAAGGMLGKAHALSSSGPGTVSTPGLGENVSNCGGNTPPGNPGLVACQTESIDGTTYYELWEQAPKSDITLQVSYTCATGFESFKIYAPEGSIKSGQTDYSTYCDGYALSQGINKNPNKYNSEPGGQITVTPTSCDQYGGEYCEVVLEVQASNPNSPNNATTGDNPYNSAGFYGGNVQVGFNVKSGNADILPANSTNANSDPSLGSNSTPDPLSFDGYSVTAHSWDDIYRQAGSFHIDDKFQATAGYNGTAYLGWENADNDSGGSGTIGWTLMDVTDPSNPTKVSFRSNGVNYDGTNNHPPGALSGSNVGPSPGDNNYAQEANNIYSANFQAQSCHTYEWVWTGNGGNDPIAVSVPFSMNAPDFNQGCWNLVPNSEVSQTGTNSYQFNNRVGNQGPYQASYPWQVQGCYYTNNNSGSCGSSPSDSSWSNNCNSANSGAVYCSKNDTLPQNTNESCSANSDGSTNYCPSYDGNKAMVNYTFPSSAKVGDGYCQRMYVADTDGPDPNSVAVSSAQCAAFSGPSDIDASTSVAPTSTTSGNATFTHTISVNASANFTYQVEGRYCNTGSGGSCNTYAITGCGSQQAGCAALQSGSATNQTTNYSFNLTYSFNPSLASPGDQYCQMLYVNPGTNTGDDPNAGVGNGGDISTGDNIDGSTGWYHDGGACTTYNPPTFSGGCYEYSGTTPKSSSYNQDYTSAVGPDDVSAPATSGRDATADIYITSNGGSTSSVQYRPDSKDSTGGAGQDYTSSPMVLGPGTQTYDFTYFPNGTSVSYYEEDYVTVSYKTVTGYGITGYDKNGNPQYGTVTQPGFTTTYDVGTVNSGTSQCYSGSCTISSVNYGPFSIEGQQYTAYVTFYNSGPQILMSQLYYTSGAQLGYSYGAEGSSSSGGTGYLSSSGYDNLTQGQTTTTIPIKITAGNGAHYETPEVQMEYIGANGFALGPACTYSPVDVYEPFNLSIQQPNISLAPSNEAPTSVSYSTQICNSTNVPVDASSTSYAYETPASGGRVDLNENGTHVSPPPIPASGCINPINTSEGINPKQANAGDQYCDSIQADYTTGYVGGGGPGDLQDMQTSASETAPCAVVDNEPYVQAFGNDVIGDSAFNATTSGGSTCGAAGDTSGIYTFSHATSGSRGPSAGSYSQFGAQALAAIEGLGSAGLRSAGNPPSGSIGLSFSNTSGTSGGSGDGSALGGNFGTSLCAPSPDYSSEELPAAQQHSYSSSDTNNSTMSSGDWNAGSGADSTTVIGSTAFPSGPNNTGTITVPEGVSAAIIVNGNAYIDSNIVYQNSNSWSSISQIPSLWIIATGNIYIDPSVTNLDGVFIAQPSGNGQNTGIIDTCANEDGAISITQDYLYGDGNGLPGCDNQLTINGAFMDQATMLDRSFSSLRYSTPGEYPADGESNSCGTPGQAINSSDSGGYPTCAAEVFNFSPEIYLAPPALEQIPGKYDYITSLSPVL
jgi:hypothetical protein